MSTSVIYNWRISKQCKAILAFLHFIIDSATPTTSLSADIAPKAKELMNHEQGVEGLVFNWDGDFDDDDGFIIASVTI